MCSGPATPRTVLTSGYDSVDDRGWFGAVAGIAFVGQQGTSNYTAGNWIHLALVREAGTTTFYVNGVASGTSTAIPNNATAPHIATNTGGTAYFSGDLAEARIFTFDPGQFNTNLLLYPGTGPSDPYADWADDFAGLTNTSSDLDFDNGGLRTGVEWVTGGDPTIGSDDAGLAPTLDNTSSATHVVFSFRRRDAAAADPETAIAVEYGSDLATWRNSITHGVADGVTIDDSTVLAGGFRQVTVSIPRSLSGTGNLFARLRVIRP
jgi:Concanavalin A-like lectin/glucanases superfamily